MSALHWDRLGVIYRPSGSSRWPAMVLAGALQVSLLLVLFRVFTPDLANRAIDGLHDSLVVTFTLENAPKPEPTPSAPAPQPATQIKQEGSAGAAGKEAKPKEITAPKAQISIMPTSAPVIASDGDEVLSGAREDGEGTGASASGTGTGAGRRGFRQGGGGSASPTVKIAGDINSARDYPRDTRKLRIGQSVIIDLTVGPDGRVEHCRVSRPSPDAEADRITCELAQIRFRFRPATDTYGNPTRALYRWQQRWFVR